jgi:hypothetical protein
MIRRVNERPVSTAEQSAANVPYVGEKRSLGHLDRRSRRGTIGNTPGDGERAER